MKGLQGTENGQWRVLGAVFVLLALCYLLVARDPPGTSDVVVVSPVSDLRRKLGVALATVEKADLTPDVVLRARRRGHTAPDERYASERHMRKSRSEGRPL